jgi:cytidylate kinase
LKELADNGKVVDAGQLKAELKDRDHKDSSRTTGPLKKAEDAVVIDSTHLTADQVVETILKHIEARVRA